MAELKAWNKVLFAVQSHLLGTHSHLLDNGHGPSFSAGLLFRWPFPREKRLPSARGASCLWKDLEPRCEAVYGSLDLSPPNGSVGWLCLGFVFLQFLHV